MTDLKLPDTVTLSRVISLVIAREPVSMPYGQAIAWVNQLISNKQLDQAASILEQMSGNFPDDLISKAQLLHIRVIQKNYTGILETADLIAPSALLDSVVAALCIRGYRQIGHIQTALNLALEARERFSGDAAIHNEAGLCFLASGKTDKAVETFDKVIAINPGFVQAYFHRAPLTAGKLSEDQVDQMIQLSGNPDLRPEQQAMLNFSVAWAYEGIDPDKHFGYLHQANSLVASTRPWDERAEFRRMIKTKEYFSSDFCRRTDHSSENDLAPIFIIGVPRSGTSLIEQILSSHDAVTSAGETGGIDLAVSAVLMNKQIPASITGWPNDFRIERYSADIDNSYRKLMAFFAPEGSLLTDKSIGNEWWCGLILSIYPYAKIIHCLRHPLDSCLSMYQQHFTEGLAYAYDLKSIARHYQHHIELMDHWKNLFPENVHSISYEDLIDAQREQTEKLLTFCGLPWQDACMNFHQTDRIARTASSHQVRQSLFRKGINRWMPYARHLKEVADILSIDISSSLVE